MAKKRQNTASRVTETPTTVCGVIRLAFIEYARRHGCKPQLEEIEWSRFKKILQRYL